MLKKKGLIIGIGDPVWVSNGIYEDLGSVIELGCEYQNGNEGIRVYFTVSSRSAIFPPTHVRPQGDTGRRSCRSGLSSELEKKIPLRQFVTPSPNSDLQTGTIKRRGRVPSKPGSRKRIRLTSDGEFSFVEEAKEDVELYSPQFSKDRVNVRSNKTDKVERKNGSKLDAKKVEPKVAKKDEEAGEKKQAKRKEATPKENADENKSAKSKTLPKTMKEPKVILVVDTESNDDEEDRPFKVEYSGTGRATCRRCDNLVLKGDIRVSHVPLFRGKPGYRVYRHLQCAVFSEEIQSAEDIGGWKNLTSDDYEKLVARVEQSKIELENENEELQPDELVPVSFQGEMRKAPLGLVGSLLPFQTEGVSWMHHQEVSENIRGGILADEMGMGKTIQTIVTILDNRPRLQHSLPGAKHPPSSADLQERKLEDRLWSANLLEWKHEMEMNNIPNSMLPKPKAGGGARAGTLVICPVIALSQWKAEIEKFTEAGALTVGTYHGPNRAVDMPWELLCKYDVVLTTYQILEADFRKMTSPNKVKCPNCGGKFKVDKLRVHLKYFCGDGAQRTEAQARQRRRGAEPLPGDRSGFRKNQTSGDKKTPEKKAVKKKMKSSPQVRIKRSAFYDSESDLSLAYVTTRTSGERRASRSAAVVARKKMLPSHSDLGIAESEDESGYEYSESEKSESDEISHNEKPKKSSKQPISRSMKVKEFPVTDDEIDGSEDEAIKQARSAQLEALSNAAKKYVGKSKQGIKGGKGQKAVTKKGKGKKFGDANVDFEGNEDDPMDAIDMNKLLREAMEGSQMSILHSVCWWRIVLDEAHIIKSRSSQTANASFALSGIHRWCLSGTPLQNRVGEFYSLIRFLRIDPMAHYFCKKTGCSCKSLHYRMLDGKCQDCGHGSVQHYSQFNKHVLNPIQRSGYSGDGRRAMFTLKNEVLDKSLLRRTKETRAEDMNLPPRLVSIRTVRLHPVEEDFYNALYTQTQSSFNDYVSDGVALNNYAHLFDLLMRMRQAVCHPYLVVHSKKGFSEQQSIGNGIAIANGSIDCDICHEPPTDRVLSSCCQAAFCQSCVRDYMAINAGDGAIPCPSCREPLSVDLNQVTEEASEISRGGSSDPMPSLKEMLNVATGSILRRINLREFATSTKIEALVEELVRMRNTSPGSKAIVFSQFVNMLDLIRWRLHSDPHLAKMGLGYRGLHGGMNVKARDSCLKEFREDSDVRILLMSLKAGGVALNLTVANHIYLMDPWWNPAAEMQAIDRTHRLGQYRPIRAVRFIAEDTVEERIVQLQDKKRLVFDGTIGRDAGSLQTLSLDDMKSLFA